MRPVIVGAMSLDGCYSGADGNPAVLPLDAAFDAYNAERLRVASTLLLGRTTYQAFKGFWPAVAGDESASDDQRDMERPPG